MKRAVDARIDSRVFTAQSSFYFENLSHSSLNFFTAPLRVVMDVTKKFANGSEWVFKGHSPEPSFASFSEHSKSPVTAKSPTRFKAGEAGFRKCF